MYKIFLYMTLFLLYVDVHYKTLDMYVPIKEITEERYLVRNQERRDFPMQ